MSTLASIVRRRIFEWTGIQINGPQGAFWAERVGGLLAAGAQCVRTCEGSAYAASKYVRHFDQLELGSIVEASPEVPPRHRSVGRQVEGCHSNRRLRAHARLRSKRAA